MCKLGLCITNCRYFVVVPCIAEWSAQLIAHCVSHNRAGYGINVSLVHSADKRKLYITQKIIVADFGRRIPVTKNYCTSSRNHALIMGSIF
jgi:hypothetical protein